MRLPLFLILTSSLFSLSLNDAIIIALQKSDLVQEKSALKKQGEALYKESFSSFMPSLNTGYILSYNAPSTPRSAYVLNSFNIRFEYNLFNGLKDYYRILDSKEKKRRTEYALINERANIALKTKDAYIGALQSKALIEVLKERQKNIQTQKNKALQFVNQGIRAKNESLSMEIALSNTLISLQSAELSLEYYIKTLEQILKSKVSSDELEDIEIDEAKVLDTDEIFLSMLERNSEYLSLLSQLDSSKYQKKQLLGNFLPSVDLSGVKYWYIDGGRAASTTYGLQSQIRFSISWNLFNGLSDGYKLQASRYYELSLQSRINALKHEMYVQAQDLVRQYNLAKEQYKISTQTLQKAQENYQITNNRYAQGIGTYTELIDAELLLNTAKTNIAQAKYGIASALAKVDYLLNKW